MDKKQILKTIIIILIIIALIYVFVLYIKKISLTGKPIGGSGGSDPDPNEYELAHNHTNISTVIGLINPPWGMLVNGTYTNYTTLNKTTEMNTTNGSRTFPPGTKIDCQLLPHEPNPCDLS